VASSCLFRELEEVKKRKLRKRTEVQTAHMLRKFDEAKLYEVKKQTELNLKKKHM